MTTDRLLEKMRERLERSKPARMVVTYEDGHQVATDPVAAITLLQECRANGITGVTTDRADYAGLAGCLDAMCRPVPNRRIEDYE